MTQASVSTPFGPLIEKILCEPDVSLLSKYYNRKVEEEQVKTKEKKERKRRELLRKEMLNECHVKRCVRPNATDSEESKEELRLKLVATRGVVTLFNAISTHQLQLRSELIRLNSQRTGEQQSDDDLTAIGAAQSGDSAKTAEIEMDETMRLAAFRAEHKSVKNLVKSLGTASRTHMVDATMLKRLQRGVGDGSVVQQSKKRAHSEVVDTFIGGADKSESDDSANDSGPKSKRRRTEEWGVLRSDYMERSSAEDEEEEDDDDFYFDSTGDSSKLTKLLRESKGSRGNDNGDSEGDDRSAESLAEEMGIAISSGEDDD